MCSHPIGVTPKMRRCKVRSSLNWQGTLKQKCLKQTCIEQGLPVIPCDICCDKSIVKITVGRRSILYVLKFTTVLKICHKVTVCNSVMFYVNLLSVFLKVYTINQWFPSASQNILICIFTVMLSYNYKW